MIVFPIDTEIYLRPGSTDMRKQINGLAALIQNDMKKDIFSKTYFLFCNKSRMLLKILYWDKNGFALWHKRLEKDKFPWPLAKEETVKLTKEEVEWLLKGIDFFKAHKSLHFSKIF